MCFVMVQNFNRNVIYNFKFMKKIALTATCQIIYYFYCEILVFVHLYINFTLNFKNNIMKRIAFLLIVCFSVTNLYS